MQPFILDLGFWHRSFLTQSLNFDHGSTHSLSFIVISACMHAAAKLAKMFIFCYNIASFSFDTTTASGISTRGAFICMGINIVWLRGARSGAIIVLAQWRRSRSIEPPTFTVNGFSLERVETFKYLGIQLSSDLSWHSHTKALCEIKKTCWTATQKLRNSFSPYILLCWNYTHFSLDQIWSMLEMQYRGHGKGPEVCNKSLPKAVGLLD